MQTILLHGRTPIVVGGTGFYLNTLLSSEATAPASTAGDKHHVEQLIAGKTWDQRYSVGIQPYLYGTHYFIILLVSKLNSEILFASDNHHISKAIMHTGTCFYL